MSIANPLSFTLLPTSEYSCSIGIMGGQRTGGRVTQAAPTICHFPELLSFVLIDPEVKNTSIKLISSPDFQEKLLYCTLIQKLCCSVFKATEGNWYRTSTALYNYYGIEYLQTAHCDPNTDYEADHVRVFLRYIK